MSDNTKAKKVQSEENIEQIIWRGLPKAEGYYRNKVSGFNYTSVLANKCGIGKRARNTLVIWSLNICLGLFRSLFFNNCS